MQTLFQALFSSHSYYKINYLHLTRIARTNEMGLQGIRAVWVAGKETMETERKLLKSEKKKKKKRPAHPSASHATTAALLGTTKTGGGVHTVVAVDPDCPRLQACGHL